MNIRLPLLAVCVLTASAIVAGAFNVDMAFDADAKITSEYLWRGKVISDDWCAQPSIRAEAQGFSLEAWGTWDLTDASNSVARTRMDLTLEYAYTWEQKVIGRAGIIAYIYKDSLVAPWQKDTFEAYLGGDLLVPSCPSVTAYYDFDQIEGWYITAGFRHSFDIMTTENKYGKQLRDWSMSLDLRADVGMADKNYNEKMFDFKAVDSDGQPIYTPKASLVDFTGIVSLPITVHKNYTLEPAIKYMTLIDSGIRDSVKASGGHVDGTAYSLMLDVSF